MIEGYTQYIGPKPQKQPVVIPQLSYSLTPLKASEANMGEEPSQTESKSKVTFKHSILHVCPLTLVLVYQVYPYRLVDVGVGVPGITTASNFNYLTKSTFEL